MDLFHWLYHYYFPHKNFGFCNTACRCCPVPDQPFSQQEMICSFEGIIENIDKCLRKYLALVWRFFIVIIPWIIRIRLQQLKKKCSSTNGSYSLSPAKCECAIFRHVVSFSMQFVSTQFSYLVGIEFTNVKTKNFTWTVTIVTKWDERASKVVSYIRRMISNIHQHYVKTSILVLLFSTFGSA